MSAAPAPPAGWPGRRPLLAAALLALATALVYLPMHHAGFVWDDDLSIARNPLLRVAAGLRDIWGSTHKVPMETHYWPLTYTTLWLDYQLWGDRAFGYHLTNLLFHVANTLLAWRLLVRLRVPGAWLAALLFGVHPVHVESVAWAIERKDVLSSFFYLGAFYGFIRFEERGRALDYALAVAAFVLALLSKSTPVTLPCALLVYLWWRDGALNARHWVRVAPFLVLAVIFGALDMQIHARNCTYQSPWGLLQRALLAGSAFWVYVRQLFWPQLAILHPKWNISPSNWVLYPALLGAIAVPVSLWLARRRLGRGPLAAALYYGLTLGPVLGLVGFEYQEQAFVADRFQYLAMLGPLALFAAGASLALERLRGRFSPQAVQAGAALACAALALPLGALTWRQVGFYRDNMTLFGRALEKNPVSPIALANLGAGCLLKGELGKAEEYLRRAIAAKPDMGINYNNLSFVMTQQGRHAEAIEQLKLALQHRPPHEASLMPWPQACASLAWYLAVYPDPALRDPAMAIRCAEEAIQYTGDPNPVILDTLAAAHAAAGEFDMACQIAEAALQGAQQAGAEERVRLIAGRLEGYRKKQPFVDLSLAEPKKIQVR